MKEYQVDFTATITGSVWIEAEDETDAEREGNDYASTRLLQFSDEHIEINDIENLDIDEVVW